MGIFADAISIIIGGLFGGKLQKSNTVNNNTILAIGIMIVSFVGFFENIYFVNGKNIVSEYFLVVLFSFIIGSKIGDVLRLEEKLSNISKTSNTSLNAFLDATLFFGVGGLQISGPILLVSNNDNSQLILKSLIDFPFAIVYGSTYGKIVSLSALPVTVIQVLIALTAYFLSAFLTPEMIAQLCAVGYIILFFSGYNLIADVKKRINNINMLPSVFIVVIFNIIVSLWR